MKFLGKQTNKPTKKLDYVPWDEKNSTTVTFDCKEFSSFCPVTGQPDYGVLKITYSPHKRLIETKSLKLFLWSYRNKKSFNELIVTDIHTQIKQQIKPRHLTVEAQFYARGGISVYCRKAG